MNPQQILPNQNNQSALAGPQMILPGQNGQNAQGQNAGAQNASRAPDQMQLAGQQAQSLNQQFGARQAQAMQQVQYVQPGMTQGQQMMAAGNMMTGNIGAQNLGAAAAQAAQAAPVSPNAEVPTSTQASLLISEMRDNVVIMKDGSFRAVVACKSINFDLMSDMEREGVEYSYQNFLNSLKFTTQILVRSQRVDIGPYIEKLVEIRRNNDNMLLGVLMDDYINFIDILSQEANIMDKSFFVVIPYYSSADAEKVLEQTKNFFKSFSRAKEPAVTRIDRTTYDRAISELNNRVDAVMSGLFQIGIQSVRLNTRELAELYYNFNNPDTAVREPLVDFSKLATLYVKKGEQE